MDAKITNSNENKANPGNYSTQGFTGDPNLDGCFGVAYGKKSLEEIFLKMLRERKKYFKEIEITELHTSNGGLKAQ